MNSATDGNKTEYLETLERLCADINDGQGRVWENNSDNYFGIPVLWKWVGEKLIIYKIDKNSTDIIPGSEVISINGKNANEIVKSKKLSITGKNEQWRMLRAAAEMRVGLLNEPMNLRLATPDGAIEEHKLSYNIKLADLTDSRPDQFRIIQDDFYYMDLTRITDRGMKNLVSELKEKLPTAKFIIFDLRGDANISEEFLGMFLNSSVPSIIRKFPVFTKPEGKPCTYLKLQSEITAKNPRVKATVVFLIDERTSGSAELIAGLAKIYKIGMLVGSQTSGTANEVFGINLPGEYKASIIGMLVETPGDTNLLQKGILPDIEVKPTIEGIKGGHDEILESVYTLFKKE